MAAIQMKGSRPQKLPPPSRTFSGDRRCRAPGCDTNLSIYNRSDLCWQHAELVFPNYRGKRLSPQT